MDAADLLNAAWYLAEGDEYGAFAAVIVSILIIGDFIGERFILGMFRLTSYVGVLYLGGTGSVDGVGNLFYMIGAGILRKVVN